MPNPPPQKLHKYPAMAIGDIPIWERFLTLYPDAYTHVDYNVVVGQGMEINPTWEPEIQRCAKALSQKRIDVVAHKAHDIHIIEIKPTLTIYTPGQILLYHFLFCKTYQPKKRCFPALIYDATQPDILDFARHHHILLFHLPH